MNFSVHIATGWDKETSGSAYEICDDWRYILMEKTSDWGYILMEKTSLVAMSNGGYRKESATPDNNLDTDFAENAAHVAARDAEIVRTGITKNLKPSQSKARRRMAKLSRRKNR